MRKKIFALLAMIFFISAFAYNAYATTQSEVDNLKAQKEKTQQELNDITEEKQSTMDEVEELDSQISKIEDEVDDLQNQLDELNSSISSKEKEIEEKEAELEEKKKLLTDRLVAMYKVGDISYLSVLLSSDSLFDMLANYDAITEVTEADNALIEKVETQKKELEDAKKELETEKSTIDSLKSQKEAKNQEYKDKKAEKDEKVKSLTSEEQAKQAKIEEYNAAIKKGEQEIQEAIKRALEEQKKKASNNSSSSNSSSGKSSINNSSGTLGWPLPTAYQSYTYITSYFGKRTRPTAGASTNHGAIDIGVSYQPVYAAESGIVVTAGYVSGYGNFIMIWHKNKGQLYTCYGHLSKFLVSSGDEVSRGEQIAVSGSTGVSTGPHLHFEVRSGGASSSCRVDPLNYLVLN